MRWTYKFLIVLDLLLTVQVIAQPASSIVSHEHISQLSRREPLPARASNRNVYSPRRPRRLGRHRSRSPTPHRAITPPTGSPQAGPSNQAADYPRTPSPGSVGSAGTTDSSSHSSPGGPSPKKQRRVQHPKTNVKSHVLKSKDYRAQTLRDAPRLPSPETYAKHEADHLLEPQMVTYYLNNYRGSKGIKASCKAALIKHLNTPENLVMLHKDANNHKNGIVAKLNEKDSAHVPKFNPDVKKHITDHKRAIMRTARKIDKEFEQHMPCGNIQGRKHGGITRAAKRLIRHAQNS